MKNVLSSDAQRGFKQKYSTQSNIIKIHDLLVNNTDIGNNIYGITISLSKAFYSNPLDKLLPNLLTCNIFGTNYNWIRILLNNKTFKVYLYRHTQNYFLSQSLYHIKIESDPTFMSCMLKISLKSL